VETGTFWAKRLDGLQSQEISTQGRMRNPLDMRALTK